MVAMMTLADRNVRCVPYKHRLLLRRVREATDW